MLAFTQLCRRPRNTAPKLTTLESYSTLRNASASSAAVTATSTEHAKAGRGYVASIVDSMQAEVYAARASAEKKRKATEGSDEEI